MANTNQQFEEAIAAAIESKDAGELELALNLGSGGDADRTLLLETLLVESWHRSHEDIIRHLQDLRSPSSVDSLRAAIILKPQLEYLRYDDYGAYYKKCFWALSVNPNPAAIGVIREFAESDDETLKSQAQYRLEKIKRT